MTVRGSIGSPRAVARVRLAAAVAALGLAACKSTSAPAITALFEEPSAVAVFRGVTTISGLDTSPTAPYPYHPFIVLANAGRNDLAIIDGTDDVQVPAPVPLRGLVYPVPGRPLHLLAADLGDRKPDLLVVVTAGDLPWLGGSRLQVIRTWEKTGAIEGAVDLAQYLPTTAAQDSPTADVVDLLALPFDPAVPGTVQVVAALAGERIAVVSFGRAASGTAIDLGRTQVTMSAPLGFQPLHLALIPGDRSRVFAASTDPLPGNVQGVAEISLTGTPTFIGSTRRSTSRAAAASPPSPAAWSPSTRIQGARPISCSTRPRPGR